MSFAHMNFVSRSFSHPRKGFEDMFCKKCPHHVRHGKVAADKKTIEFSDQCGLKMKAGKAESCDKYPFQAGFNYIECETYRMVFKSNGTRNECVPTSDFQFTTDGMNGTPITEMELL
jgi:hypothetical protein